MKKIILSLVMFSSLAYANDLKLPGEKWVAVFDKYVCAAFGEAVARPQMFEDLKVNFERITTDSTLDNVLLRATFEQDGQLCRYNAILFADNAAQTYELVQSIAYDPEAINGAGYRACLAGKAVLDNAFVGNKYLYYGHPHNAALMINGVGAESICGGGTIGVNFVVKGRLRKE